MGHRRILLIDDDRLQHRLVQGFITRFRTGPWECDGANDFATGMEKLLSGKHSVCLLDYRLGDLDGLKLLREARAAGCTVPVIFLTADESTEFEDAAMDAGAVDYLVKGEINPRALERSIRYAVKLGEAMERLNQLATRDSLTGLFNRRDFERVLHEEWQRSVRFGRPFVLVMADIDHFKRINDQHGHPVGDAVLKHVASMLAGQLRAVDRVARYGGEEFAIIMVETTCKQAVERMQRIAALLAEIPCNVPGVAEPLAVTFSAGCAELPGHASDPAALVAAADKALYGAKAAGRNLVVSASLGRGASA